MGAKTYKTVERRNITQPIDWWAAIAKQAEKEGKSISGWIGEACRAKLPKRVKLSERAPACRPREEK